MLVTRTSVSLQDEKLENVPEPLQTQIAVPLGGSVSGNLKGFDKIRALILRGSNMLHRAKARQF